MFGGKISVTNYPKLNLASKHIAKSSKGPKSTIMKIYLKKKPAMVGNTVGKSHLPRMKVVAFEKWKKRDLRKKWPCLENSRTFVLSLQTKS